ncbi:MAG: transporter [Planctomycetota bacterium]
MRNLQQVVLMGVLVVSSVCLAGEATPPAINVAEEKESPEHGKLNTADATPVEPGHVELEFGYSYSRAKRCWDADRKLQSRGLCEEHAPSVALTVGALKNLDFNINFNYLWLHDKENSPTHGNAIGDIGIGGRYRFLNIEKHNLEVAYIGGFTIPTGSKSSSGCLGTSQEFWSWENALVVSKDWGLWTANAEVGYSLPFGGKRSDARGTFTANLAAGYQVLRWLQPEVELNYVKDFVKSDSESFSVTGGLVMPVNDRLRVNVGVQQAVWGRAADQSTSFLLGVKLAF